MKVLVYGSGGREHAICWKLAHENSIQEVYVAPGNPGIALEPKVVCTGLTEFTAVENLCREKGIEFVVVGPDQALADGLVDFLTAKGIAAFGPTSAAARVEWSKAFAKDVMQAARIPTARFQVFAEAAAAQEFLRTVEWGDGWVIKADGLALGKGVVVCANREEALAAAKDFQAGAMGEAGKTIVIEERLLGRETSGFFLCDGNHAVPVGFACDYKRIGDGDQGPNTGGMGAFSPADWLPSGMEMRVQSEIAEPLLVEMKKRGAPFRGILFVGLMITADGPKVIEFNARFGDPETQAILPLLDEDLLPWFVASAKGELHRMPATGPKRKPLTAVHVVQAAAGYPGTGNVKVRKGDLIQVPARFLPGVEEKDFKLFFAGVAKSGDGFVTNGGRVLGLTALASTRAEARKRAYEAVSGITFAGAQRRSDVGA